ncbi:Crp/Fnr family transcriptional regulator [Sphingomonas sp.]|uniref:Crp/Fnr family transcriptional regulator n=1 Tax=Sphingomonas sp. TaxID=28214 RepID=UPI003AFF708A
MPAIEQSELRNRLLRQLSPDDFALLADHLEPFACERGDVLFKADQLIGHAHFLDEGVGSLIASSSEGQRVEAGLFGREGFTPVCATMETDWASYDALIQLSDSGHRIPIGALQDAAERSASLRSLPLRNGEAPNVQIGFTALSNAVHAVEERLARWLLVCHDRVRRPSVTTALHILEGNGFIRSERRCVIIRNRAALRSSPATPTACRRLRIGG